ncbi:hypothetical protein BMS3Abin04_02947 [bacterium BMS3Abin04]|nr:hypothetical protein BMS3Abin04_02947 [bacterium BMS3Abin04]
MNKIVLNFGLLIFFISVVVFSQKGMLVQDVLIRSTIVFFVVTIMFSILALAFIKAINKTGTGKQKHINHKLAGSGENE